MKRKPNTTKEGNSWTTETIKSVWSMGSFVPGLSPETWRSDVCGKKMKWAEFGNRSSKDGWEIDHIVPVSKGGSDGLENLQPLHWENNSDKGDQLKWRCPE